jgi:zinc transporter, ZIP family
MTWFLELNPYTQALLATLFTWGVTALGASGVFLIRKPNRALLDTAFGFAGGVMVAASYWSLLAPSIELSSNQKFNWLPATVGFLLGALFLFILEKLTPHLNISEENLFFRTANNKLNSKPLKKTSNTKNLTQKKSWHRTLLIFFAVTLHNIPEGLAIGVAFGALAHQVPGVDIGGAVALAIGVGIQNFPEGFAVSIPFQREGLSKAKAFFLGQASAIVEPISAVIGAVAVTLALPTLPYALAFAAGAMIFVTVKEIIPESQQKTSDLPALGFIAGFTIMMILDVAFG